MVHALVLAGGGAKGAWQASAARVVIEHFSATDEPIRLISGTSAGALNAAAIVQHGPGWTVELWQAIRVKDVFSGGGWLLGRASRFMRAWKGRGGFYSTEPLRRLIHEELDAQAIADAPMKLLIHAVDVRRRVQVTWGNRSPHLLEGIRASGSIPIAFPPVRIGELELVDGGLVANVPVRAAVEAGARRITAIIPDRQPFVGRMPIENALHLQAIERPRQNALEQIGEILDTSLDKQFEAEHKMVGIIYHVVRSSPDHLPGYHEIRLDGLLPSFNLGGLLDFHRDHLDRLLRMGEVDAERWVKGLGG